MFILFCYLLFEHFYFCHSTLLSTCGIILPALITSIWQPSSRLRASIIDLLCSVAFDTTAPSILIGSKWATGDTAPDLPTCHVTEWSVVITPVSCFFRAKAPLG